MTFLTKPCRKCKGKGFRYVRDYFDPSEVVPEDCEECDGTGEVSDVIQVGDGLFARRLANGNCVRCDTSLMVLWNVRFVIWCMEIIMDGKDNWNDILAEAIASNEIVFFEGQRISNHNKKDILKRLWLESFQDD